VKIRTIWAIKGTKPKILSTGSHKKIVCSGALAEDGTHLFRTYNTADSDAFLNFLKKLHKKYPKMILFIDKAPWHREKRINHFFRKNRETIKKRWFPSGNPEANPMEECWKQGKQDILGSIFYDSFQDFKTATTKYYRTKRFKLNLYKYLCH